MPSWEFPFPVPPLQFDELFVVVVDKFSDSFPRFLTFLRCRRLMRFFSIVVAEAVKRKKVNIVYEKI